MDMNGIANLEAMLALADGIDRREGKLAYSRYNALMLTIADEFQIELPKIVAAFVALSPNNDYVGNLRSLVTVLRGIREGREKDAIKVSTYKHCRDRAYWYLTGRFEFLQQAKGPKIRNFYFNITEPFNPEFVTIDGHISALWQGRALTMKQAIIRRRDYKTIADALKELAASVGLIANQLQATLWFARKRTFNIKYDSQFDLFDAADDRWRTMQRLSEIRPYQ
jgi:hypothetical protein